MHDVVVVGGGPVGSYTAAGLAALGRRVLVLERRESLDGPVCCTGIISRECVETFSIDRGLVLRPGGSATMFSPSGKILKVARDEPPACIVDRTALDASMAAAAVSSGAEYVTGSHVTGVSVGRDGVTLEVTRGGDRQSFQGRAAVIACGLGSGLTEKLGLGRPGDIMMGVQAEVSTVDLAEVEMFLGGPLAPGSFGWLVPTSPGRGLAGLMLRRDAASCMRKLLLHLETEGKIVPGEHRPLFRAIPIKTLPRTCADRAIVVGSAAGQVKPTTGGGIFFGLICARVAIDSLHHALEHDDLSAISLSTYERGWRKRLGRELKTGYWARRIYERLSDRQIDHILEMLGSSGIISYVINDRDFSFDWHGGTALRLLGHRTISSMLGPVKLPFVS